MSTTYFGGIPTRIEVKKLRDSFPNEALAAGAVITHEQVADLIDCEYRTNRYRAVTNAWRKEVERETSKIIGPDPEGFRVLSEGEKVKLSSSKIMSAGRAARRSYVVASRVDTKKLSDQDMAEYDHNVKKATAVITAARVKAKVALPEL